MCTGTGKAKGLTQACSQLRGETAHDMLDARVLLEAVGAQVLAVAALLEAAWPGLGLGFRFGGEFGVGPRLG